MNVFYAPDVQGDSITLIDQEAQHCIKVLRKSRGEIIFVIDGKGTRYQCVIVDSHRHVVELRVVSKEYKEPNPNLPHIAFGLIKNTGRLEWLLEKLTEIGATRMTPIICQRSERSSVKSERLNKIIVSALKQSLGYYLPLLDPPTPLEDYLKDQIRSNKFIASFGEEVPQLTSFSERRNAPVILIGPEGDFTDAELQKSMDAGYRRVNLGNNRLRAETAAVVACTLLRF